MFFSSADAKTSAGAPCSIEVSRSDDEPKLRSILVPGCAASKAFARSVKLEVSDDAPSTVMLPVSLLASVDAVGLLLDPHAAKSSAAVTAMTQSERT